MHPIEFLVEIHCLYVEPNSRYRIYANNNLLVERTWRWGTNIYIEENIWLNLNLGFENIIKIESLSIHKSLPPFILKNFKIIDRPINITSNTNLAVSFVI
jgi:hypothetical protein